MIKLFDNFAIDSDDRNVVFGEIKIRNNPKTGKTETQMVPHGYYTSVRAALTAAARYLDRQAIHDRDYTVAEAVEKINAIESRFENLLSKIKEEMPV